MKTRQKLRTTHVGELGDGSLADSVSLRSERTTAPGAAPVRDPMPAEGDIVGGCYRLVRRLGEGMFGSVFEAVRTDVPEHRVALKVVRRSIYAGRNVVRELVMLAAATHPNIVQLKDHGVARDYVWLTMPLYEGETLAERLERGPLGMREAYEIFLPIARGVHALHERGLRHQDIKPENLFLAQLGDRIHPVLLDLGVAVERHATYVAGTALYGAPEQIAALGGLPHAGVLSEKIDSYGLASTLLHGLVGPGFFPGEDARTPYELAEAFAVREERPLSPGALPDLTGQPRRDLERALARWLQRDPEARPSAAQLADELDVLLEPEREAARQIEASIERQRRSNRRMRLVVVGLVVGAGALGLFAYGHRETLRLAAELRQARAEGAASFDQLDTCVAAHRVSATRAVGCEEARKQEAQNHLSAVEQLQATSAATEEAFARRLATVNTRLRTCRDEATEAAEAFAEERTTLVEERRAVEKTLRERESAWQAARTALESERDALEGERDALERERDAIAEDRASLAADKRLLESEQRACSERAASLEAETRRCEGALASCREARDICQEASPTDPKDTAAAEDGEPAG